MNVQEFVRNALVEIASAVNDANDSFAAQGIDANANPRGAESENKSGSVTYLDVTNTQYVEFDIAVTVAEAVEQSSSKKGGLALQVVS